VPRWYNVDTEKVDPGLAREAEAYAQAGRSLARERAGGAICPHCKKGFLSTLRLRRHLNKSACAAREKPPQPQQPKPEPPKQGRGLVDPHRPELGKVPKNSLMHAVLQRQIERQAQQKHLQRKNPKDL
jgi:hypothetical protein